MLLQRWMARTARTDEIQEAREYDQGSGHRCAQREGPGEALAGIDLIADAGRVLAQPRPAAPA
jgi:hypothetical protein